METKSNKTMLERTGGPAITAAERASVIKETTKAGKAAAVKAMHVLSPLSDSDRQSIYRPPAGIEAPASALATVLLNDVELAAKVPQIEAQEILDKIRLLAEINDARTSLVAWLRRLDDTALVEREELFRMSTVIQRLAKVDPETSPELVEKVKVLDQYLARGKRGVKPEDDEPVVEEPTEPFVPFSNGHANGADKQ